ncbi:MAG: hypothetical protein Tsb0032_00970 [Kiloniellaceae bacterium]
MSDAGNLAQLTLFRLDGNVFRDDDGAELKNCPAVLSDLHQYWQSLCRGAAFPARADIDPVDIPALLEHLVLIDVLRDPLDFRYRLVGGHIVQHAGRNVQGKTIRGLMADGGPRARELQGKAMAVGEILADRQEPLCIELTYDAPEGQERKRLQAIFLPLAEPGEGMNMVLGGLSYLE